MKYYRYTLSFLILLFSGGNLFGQLNVVNTSMTPAQIVQNVLVGGGIVVTNVQFQGQLPQQIGVFTTGVTPTNLGMTSGIVISSGDVMEAPGPNSSSSITANTSSGSDPDLAALLGSSYTINDAAVLQFDFVPISDTIKFRWVFGSDEYHEYVNSSFNDVFGFFISGPGINGSYSNNAVNIALIPNTTLPVTIDNVNNGTGGTGPCTNCNYFINNTGGGTIEYDGFTVKLTAWRIVTPCQTYHIKIALGDAGDSSYDSAVFLEAGSFGCNGLSSDISYSSAVDTTAIRGCSQGVVTFSLVNPISTPTTINYQIGGTAVNGVDYTTIGNSVVIPAGQTSASIVINPLVGTGNAPIETVYIITNAIPCQSDTIAVYIHDYQSLSMTTISDTAVCSGSNVTLGVTVTGGITPYTYNWNNGQTSSSISVTPGATTTYTVTVNEGCNYYSDDATITVNPEPIASFDVTPTCGSVLPDQINWTTVTYEGTYEPGATFFWHFEGNPQPASTYTTVGPHQIFYYNIQNPTVYNFSLCVTNPSGCSSCDTQQVAVQVPSCCGKPLPFAGNDDASCGLIQPLQATFHSLSTGYWSSDPGNPGSAYFSYSDSVSTNVSVTDTGIYNFIWTESYPDAPSCILRDTVQLTFNKLPEVSFSVTPVSCYGNTTNIEFTGAASDYLNYSWNFDNAIVNSGANLGPYNVEWSVPGPHVVSLTAENTTCSASIEHIVNIPPPLGYTLVVKDNSCNGSCDGEVFINVTGGTPPYTYLNAENSPLLTNLCAGYFGLKALDANGCFIFTGVTITEPPQLTMSSTVASPLCNELTTGAINLNVFGGTPEYSFLWSDNSYEQNRANLSAGLYFVTVKDYNECFLIDTIEVVEPDALNANIITTNTHCMQNNGTASVNLSGGVSPYNLLWSDPDHQTSFEIDSLSAGIYFVTVTDFNNCMLIVHASVNDIEGPVVTAEGTNINTCHGDSTGTLSSTVSGGTPPYLYSWTNGGLGNLVSNVPAGNYSVAVTDSAGCIGTGSVQILEPVELMIDYSTSDITCNGAGDGFVSISVSGGIPPFLLNFKNILYNVPVIITGLSPDAYTLTISDSSNCTKSVSVIINEPDSINAIHNVTQVSCFGGSNGSIYIETPNGGTAPYSFFWSTGQTSNFINGLTTGTYILTITDHNSCQYEQMFFVDQNAPVVLTSVLTNATSATSNDGEINLTADGGFPPYTFLWSTSDGSEDLVNLFSGDYQVTVTDAFGCFLVDSFIVDFSNKTHIQSNNSEIKIYPNPTDGKFHIQCDIGTVIDIYDISGRKIHTELVTGKITQLDIGGFAFGCYFIQLRNKEFSYNAKIFRR